MNRSVAGDWHLRFPADLRAQSSHLALSFNMPGRPFHRADSRVLPIEKYRKFPVSAVIILCTPPPGELPTNFLGRLSGISGTISAYFDVVPDQMAPSEEKDQVRDDV